MCMSGGGGCVVWAVATGSLWLPGWLGGKGRKLSTGGGCGRSLSAERAGGRVGETAGQQARGGEAAAGAEGGGVATAQYSSLRAGASDRSPPRPYAPSSHPWSGRGRCPAGTETWPPAPEWPEGRISRNAAGEEGAWKGGPDGGDVRMCQGHSIHSKHDPRSRQPGRPRQRQSPHRVEAAGAGGLFRRHLEGHRRGLNLTQLPPAAGVDCRAAGVGWCSLLRQLCSAVCWKGGRGGLLAASTSPA
jgi:hypothetical protein